MKLATAAARLCCLAAALSFTGCDNDSGTTPSSLFTTETFTGSVARGATPLAAFHTFITGQNAPVIIRMTSFTPSTVTMGLALGTPATLPTGAPTCSISVGQAAVQQGSEFLVTLGPATYCIAIFDIGNIPESTTVSYTTVVQHK